MCKACEYSVDLFILCEDTSASPANVHRSVNSRRRHSLATTVPDAPKVYAFLVVLVVVVVVVARIGVILFVCALVIIVANVIVLLFVVWHCRRCRCRRPRPHIRPSLCSHRHLRSAIWQRGRTQQVLSHWSSCSSSLLESQGLCRAPVGRSGRAAA